MSIEMTDTCGEMMEGREDRLRQARELLKIRSAAQAAKQFGWQDSTYRSHENGTRDFKPDDARKYAEALGVRFEWLFYGRGPMDAVGSLVRDRPSPNARIGGEISLVSARELPVRGQAMGGPEGALAWSDVIWDKVPCPPVLMSVPDAYAVYVSGDSMEPRYFAGETVFVHPGRPPRAGDFVLLQLEDGVENTIAYVKRLVSRTSDEVVVEQYNPAKRLTFPASEIAAIHRVVAAQNE